MRGIEVVASVREEEVEFARELGARHAVDRQGDVAAQVRAIAPLGVDAAIDCAGGAAAEPAFAAVRDGGRFVTPAGRGDLPEGRGVEAEGIFVKQDPDALADLARLVDTGDLTLRVGPVFDLQDAAAAHERLAAGGVRGKVVLRLA